MKICFLFIFLISVIFNIEAQDSSRVFYGKATYYHKRFEGRKTSNGEKFHHKNFTCANNTLPFNTFIKVENLDNNKVTVLRVNDRLPKRSKVMLDLTFAAARELDFVKKGSANIRVAIIDTASVHDSLLVMFAEALKGMKVHKSKPIMSIDSKLLASKSDYQKENDNIKTSGKAISSTSEENDRNVNHSGFGIQVLSYHSKKKANEIANILEKKYEETVSVREKEIKGKMYYRVIIGQYNSKSDLLAVKSKLEKDYKDCYAMKLD